MRRMLAASVIIVTLGVSALTAGAANAQIPPPPVAPPTIQVRPDIATSPAIQEGLRQYVPLGAVDRWRIVRMPTRMTRATMGAQRCLPAVREVTIEGTGFGAARNARDIVIVRRKVMGVLDIVSWSDTRIVGRIPTTIADRDRYDLIMAPQRRGEAPRSISDRNDPIASLSPVSNLVSVVGCPQFTITPGTVTARAPTIDPLLTHFPRDRCRNVDLDSLDLTSQRLAGVPAYPGASTNRTVFYISDRNGTLVSFAGPSSDMVAGAFFFILENWLTRVCFGPTLGNYDNHPTARLMLWTDQHGRLPLRSVFDGRDDRACPGCGDTGTAFKQCRVVPDLSRLAFVEVPPGSRDTRTPRERRPVSPVRVWGIRTSFTVGPREFYAVEPWPLFLSAADVDLGKRIFAGRDTTVCSFGAFNVRYGLSGPIGSGTNENDGMQFFVRLR